MFYMSRGAMSHSVTGYTRHTQEHPREPQQAPQAWGGYSVDEEHEQHLCVRFLSTLYPYAETAVLPKGLRKGGIPPSKI